MRINLSDAGFGLAVEAAGWSTDTRTLAAGDVYFALKGPSFDGHDFVAEALRKGAVAVFVERAIEGAVIVPDVLAAMQQLAAWARARWSRTVAAITGSAGKTSTKDTIADLLGARFQTGRTAGNLNNHIGVPLSILRLDDDCDCAALEMGMNHAGEIRALCEIARPDIGVVTNVGWAHAENFADGIDGVARAKRELIDSLPAGGVAVLNADDERVAAMRTANTVTYGLSEGATVRATDLNLRGDGSSFAVDGTRFDLPLPGAHAVRNTLAGIAVAQVMGIGARELVDRVAAIAPGKMRGERIAHNGATLINDCYNANPEAMKAMLDVLAATPAARRIAVLGEMLELGGESARLHAEVGRYARSRGIHVVVGISGEASEIATAAHGMFFADAPTAGDFLRGDIRAGDAVLFKGSRGVRVEQALERVIA